VNYLLDTCILSELIKTKPDKRVIKWVSSVPEERLYLSVLTLGELQKGIVKLGTGERQNRLLRWLDEDVRQRFEGKILSVDEETMMLWGKLAGEAERKGKPLPLLDIILASSAIVNHMTFVIRNISDVQGLGVEILNPWE